MKLCLSVVCAPLILSALFGGQLENGSGIVYGPGHMFSVTAPHGWILDNESGKPQGLQAVFYPKGDTYRDSVAFMYANGTAFSAEHPTRESVMKYDLDRFRNDSPKVQVKTLPQLRTADGRTAIVRQFQGDKYGNVEVVAYVEEKTAVIMIVLSSRNKARYDQAYPAFVQLVASYQFIGSDVQINKAARQPN
jgi:hypothetical protein